MANLKSVIESCLCLAWSLCGLDVDKYLSALLGSDETNFEVFAKFAGACPTPVLAVLFRLGHFVTHEKLIIIAGEIVEMRKIFNDDEEEDVGGYIAFLLLYHRRKVSEADTIGKL